MIIKIYKLFLLWMINSLMFNYINKYFLISSFIQEFQYKPFLWLYDQSSFFIKPFLNLLRFNLLKILFIGHRLLYIFIFLCRLIFSKFLLIFLHKLRIGFEKFHKLLLLRELLFSRSSWERIFHFEMILKIFINTKNLYFI